MSANHRLGCKKKKTGRFEMKRLKIIFWTSSRTNANNGIYYQQSKKHTSLVAAFFKKAFKEGFRHQRKQINNERAKRKDAFKVEALRTFKKPVSWVCVSVSDVNLREKGKSGPIFLSRKLLNVGAVVRLLLSELVAREAEHGERFLLLVSQVTMQRREFLVVFVCVSALAC